MEEHRVALDRLLGRLRYCPLLPNLGRTIGEAWLHWNTASQYLSQLLSLVTRSGPNESEQDCETKDSTVDVNPSPKTRAKQKNV